MAERSEAQRRADAKYYQKHKHKRNVQYSNIQCRVRADIAEDFKAACKEAGTNPNAVLRAAINDFLQEETL